MKSLPKESLQWIISLLAGRRARHIALLSLSTACVINNISFVPRADATCVIGPMGVMTSTGTMSGGKSSTNSNGILNKCLRLGRIPRGPGLC
jgi:hypothetical protein